MALTTRAISKMNTLDTPIMVCSIGSNVEEGKEEEDENGG